MNPKNSPSRSIRRSRAARRSGFTLVEILVATAGAVVVGGIILGLFEQSQRAARKIIARQEALETGQSALNQIAAKLRGAIRPDALDAPAAPSAAAPTAPATFASDAMEFPILNEANEIERLAVKAPRDQADTLVVFQSIAAGTPSAAAAETAPGAAPGTPAAARPASSIKFEKSVIKAAVSFRYATGAKPGEPVAYAPEMKPGEWPALIEILYESHTAEPYSEAVVLRTAVAPGSAGGNR